MRQIQELRAEPRTGTGKGPAYQTRQKGFVPAIVYGGEGAPATVQVLRHDLERLIERHVPDDALHAGRVRAERPASFRAQVQLDPVSDRPVHTDFMRLPEGATIRLAIPVRFKGQESSPGLKRGGVLNIVRHEVELLCPAENIPDFIEGDLSGLDIHGSLHISALRASRRRKAGGSRARLHDRLDRGADSVIEEQRAAAAAAVAAASAPVVEKVRLPPRVLRSRCDAAAAQPPARLRPLRKAPDKK